MSLAAFLLCAGRGERLRPLTERIPKPALTLLGKSVLEINKFALESLAPDLWLANSHHLPEPIDALCRRLGMQTLHEPEILGTGGCLGHAAPLLGECDTILVHNADIIHTIDLADLLRRHKESGALATLAGVSGPADTLSAASDGRLLGVHGYEDFDAGEESARLTFSGIACYESAFLRFAGPGPEDVKRYWSSALAAGAAIRVENCLEGANWHDIGSPQGLWDAAKFMMEAAGEFSHNYHPLLCEPKPYVANEAGQEGLPEFMHNVLVCEETSFSVPPGTRNCVLGRDFKWDIQP